MSHGYCGCHEPGGRYCLYRRPFSIPVAPRDRYAVTITCNFCHALILQTSVETVSLALGRAINLLATHTQDCVYIYDGISGELLEPSVNVTVSVHS